MKRLPTTAGAESTQWRPTAALTNSLVRTAAAAVPVRTAPLAVKWLISTATVPPSTRRPPPRLVSKSVVHTSETVEARWAPVPRLRWTSTSSKTILSAPSTRRPSRRLPVTRVPWSSITPLQPSSSRPWSSFPSTVLRHSSRRRSTPPSASSPERGSPLSRTPLPLTLVSISSRPAPLVTTPSRPFSSTTLLRIRRRPGPRTQTARSAMERKLARSIVAMPKRPRSTPRTSRSRLASARWKPPSADISPPIPMIA